MSLLCTRCKKRQAIVFLTMMEEGKMENKGLCLKCAKELNIPQVKEMMEQMGINEEDMDLLEDNMNDVLSNLDEGFELGGAMPFPGFLQKLMGKSEENQLSPVAESNDLPTKKPEPKAKSTQSSERKEAKKRKFLDSFCENLTTKAREGKMDRVVGRDNEIYRVMQILNRRTKNNPCLIGEPGVGKTAIAEGIAQRLAEGDVPPRLADKELYLLDLTALVAGTQFRGQFESRVKGLVQDIKEAGNVILFVDEMHNLVGAGDAEGSMNAANILKPALSRGEVQMIGATTFNEYRKHIEKDAALERRFQPVTVTEPSIADATEVLKGIKGYYEEFHRVKVSDEVVRQAVIMSERYITDRYLPDKAIDLLDEACSCSTLDNQALYEYEKISRQLQELQEKESDPPMKGDEVDFAAVAQIKSEIIKLSKKHKEIESQAMDREVTLDDLARVVELWTSIPATKIKESELSKVADLEKVLAKKVIGQEEAIRVVAAAVRRTRISLGSVRRPASFIFVGPTGVGKTELVKVLSKELFDSTDPLIRLDMSEYMEKHAVSRIVGSPPGYVGYDEAGQLTEKIRRKPYSVVLFDEIEKAHPDVLNILLQILDEGKITDAHGRVVSFENTVIVMTSNAGSQFKDSTVGFNKSAQQVSYDKAMKALSEFLRPEFLARIDEIVVFRPLEEADFKKIAALMLDEFKDSLNEHGMKFNYDEKALSVIAKKAYGHKAGARDIRKVIRREVEDQITMKMVTAEKEPITLISLTAEGEELTLLTV